MSLDFKTSTELTNSNRWTQIKQIEAILMKTNKWKRLYKIFYKMKNTTLNCIDDSKKNRKNQINPKQTTKQMHCNQTNLTVIAKHSKKINCRHIPNK